MNFRAIHYFVAVYEELSLSLASKRCFVAQPSISSAIQQLEGELECKLFVRHTKGVTPTPDGETLYPYARKLLEDIQAIKMLYKEPTRPVSLTIALMPFLSGKRISLIFKALLGALPGLDLEVVDLTEVSDARIITASQVGKEETFHKLWVDRYVLAMPEGHPLSIYTAIPLAELDDAPFISRQPCDVNDAWQFAMQQSGVLLDVKATVKNEEYALDLVAAGLGVSVVPNHSTSGRSNIVTRTVQDVTLEREVGLAYDVAKPLAPQLLEAIQLTQGQMEM